MNQSSDVDGYMRALLDRVETSGSSLDIDEIIKRGRRRRRVLRTAEVASAVVVTAGVVGVAAAINVTQNEGPVTHPSLTGGGSNTTSPAASGDGSCVAGDLSIRLGLIGGAMGTTYQEVTVRNTGTARCKLSGYAKATFTGGDLGQTTYQAGDDRGNPTTVRLAARQEATFQLAAVSPANFPNGCSSRTPAHVIIAVPSTSTSPSNFHWTQQICTDSRSSVYVTPYVRKAATD